MFALLNFYYKSARHVNQNKISLYDSVMEKQARPLHTQGKCDD